MTEQQLLTRNLSVIAHVDHGKTSTADGLLAAAGQLNEKNVGQCALDGALAESKERGITIVASAVALQFDSTRETLLEARTLAIARMDALGLRPLAPFSASSVVESNDDDDDDDGDDDKGEGEITFHIEGVPFDCDADRLRAALAAQLPSAGAPLDDVDVSLRKNHSARIVVRADRVAVVDWLRAHAIVLGGLSLRAEAHRGASLVSRAHAVARSLAMTSLPTFVVTRDGEQFACDGHLAPTRREARHAAASAWLAAHEPVAMTTPSTTTLALLPEMSPTCATSVQVNLIDSPGHVDFSAEVTSALRLTDGALVVVDAVEGIAAQTNSVLRQALRERVRCVLFVNKIDRAIEQQQLESRDLASKLDTVIDGVNVSLAGAQAPLAFAAGTVAFGSALEGWAVSIDSFCAMISAARGAADAAAVRAKLSAGDDALFVRLVLEPIYRLRAACAAGDADAAIKMLSKVERAPQGKNLEQWRELVDAKNWKLLTRLALKLMCPLADALVGMMIRHLPSPLEAQRVRADVLYHVPNAAAGDDVAAAPAAGTDDDDDGGERRVDEARDDAALRAIRLCDAQGPTILFASKQIAINGRSFSIARLFAGRVRVGDELLVYDTGATAPRKAKVGGLVVPSVRAPIRVDVAEAGSIVAIAGIALTGGTATSSADAAPLSSMSALVSDVVGLVLRLGPGAKGDARKKLVDAARTLAASDVALRVIQGNDGQLVMRGVGELHLEIALSRLRSAAGVPIEASPPVVALRETVLRASTRSFLGKSSNKLNRVYMMAEPIEKALATSLESATTDAERRAALLRHGYSAADAKRVLAFGGVSALLVDRTSGVSVAPIADSLVQAFKQLADDGVLASMQPLVGVALVLVDCRYHADAKHRAPGDVVPPTLRAMTAALLSTSLRLVEPDLRAEINCDARVSNDVYAVLHRRGAVCTALAGSAARGEQRFVTVAATLSVRQSIGLVGDLRAATKGQAFAAMSPSGWRLVASDPFDAQSDAGQLVSEARVRGGMSATPPSAADVEDRL